MMYILKNNFNKNLINKEKLTKEKCSEEAKKFVSRNEFKKKSFPAYNQSLKNDWLDELCSHYDIKYHRLEYWTKESCLEKALKFNNRSDFNRYEYTAHKIASKNKWLDDICSHMKKINDKKRCIYVYEFSDKSVYVGLTYDIKNRHNRHINDINSSVFIKMKELNELIHIKKVTDYLDINAAKEKEEEFVNIYREKGWLILNKTKTGSIGSNTIKWTKEKCHEIALKYNSRKEYSINSSSYYSAYKNNWLDDICTHMKQKRNKNGYWTKEKCHEIALKYNTRTIFYNSYPGVYSKACKNKWLDDICSHMNK